MRKSEKTAQAIYAAVHRVVTDFRIEMGAQPPRTCASDYQLAQMGSRAASAAVDAYKATLPKSPEEPQGRGR